MIVKNNIIVGLCFFLLFLTSVIGSEKEKQYELQEIVTLCFQHLLIKEPISLNWERSRKTLTGKNGEPQEDYNRIHFEQDGNRFLCASEVLVNPNESIIGTTSYTGFNGSSFFRSYWDGPLFLSSSIDKVQRAITSGFGVNPLFVMFKSIPNFDESIATGSILLDDAIKSFMGSALEETFTKVKNEEGLLVITTRNGRMHYKLFLDPLKEFYPVRMEAKMGKSLNVTEVKRFHEIHTNDGNIWYIPIEIHSIQRDVETGVFLGHESRYKVDTNSIVIGAIVAERSFTPPLDKVTTIIDYDTESIVDR